MLWVTKPSTGWVLHARASPRRTLCEAGSPDRRGCPGVWGSRRSARASRRSAASRRWATCRLATGAPRARRSLGPSPPLAFPLPFSLGLGFPLALSLSPSPSRVRVARGAWGSAGSFVRGPPGSGAASALGLGAAEGPVDRRGPPEQTSALPSCAGVQRSGHGGGRVGAEELLEEAADDEVVEGEAEEDLSGEAAAAPDEDAQAERRPGRARRRRSAPGARAARRWPRAPSDSAGPGCGRRTGVSPRGRSGKRRRRGRRCRRRCRRTGRRGSRARRPGRRRGRGSRTRPRRRPGGG